MQIELLFRTANKELYLNQRHDFSVAAWALLEDSVVAEPDNDYYKRLKTKLPKQKDLYSWVWKRINTDWAITPDIAKSYKPLDFVYPRTFTPKTKTGKALIMLFEHDDSVFMMNAQTWIGTDLLRLEFILCHIDKKEKLLADYNAGKLNF
ncbi:hypothetical protein [uncultured Draconibacterium sp.]|uniref:hypothetical protein n=1 Tax=uncultured Draconibacterium sp. TaxID=1573823 RepID=UPI0025FDD658|nr:hypothetical protein [uncultured Draconibacterium sp.]